MRINQSNHRDHARVAHDQKGSSGFPIVSQVGAPVFSLWCILRPNVDIQLLVTTMIRNKRRLAQIVGVAIASALGHAQHSRFFQTFRFSQHAHKIGDAIYCRCEVKHRCLFCRRYPFCACWANKHKDYNTLGGWDECTFTIRGLSCSSEILVSSIVLLQAFSLTGLAFWWMSCIMHDTWKSAFWLTNFSHSVTRRRTCWLFHTYLTGKWESGIRSVAVSMFPLCVDYEGYSIWEIVVFPLFWINGPWL
jgi:hypothetical protein